MENKQPTSKASHTPTPWHRNVSPAWKYPIYADKNGDPNGKDWIHIGAVLADNPNAEADLDFIVRAVNSHEDTLQQMRYAVGRLRKAWSYPNSQADSMRVGLLDAMTLLEQAITKAEASDKSSGEGK